MTLCLCQTHAIWSITELSTNTNTFYMYTDTYAITAYPEGGALYRSVGSQVNLHCHSANATVSWTFPDSAICVEHVRSGPDFNITNLQPSQVGTYMCNVTSEYVNDAVTFEIGLMGNQLTSLIITLV